MVGSPHPNPLEVVEAAVGVVDLAWTAIERHRDHASSHDSAWEDGVKLEGQLAHERSENHRLKSELEECQKALHQLQSVPRQRDSAATSPADGLECPSDLYEQLKKKADSATFLERLKDLHQGDTKDLSASVTKIGEDLMVNADPDDPSWWLWITDELFASEGKEESDCLESDGYIVVNQDDVIEGVAVFIAKLLVSNPNAKKMTPEELQKVVSMSFTRMESKGRLRKLWTIAKFLYVTASWSAAAVGLYKNPFIVKVILKALSLSSRLIIKILV